MDYHSLAFQTMSPKDMSWRESITYDEARDDDSHNMLVELTYPDKEAKFFDFIHSRSSLIESRVSHHLHVSRSRCHMDKDHNQWMKGSFNLCVPVKIDGFGRVIVRLPFLYRVGGKENGDEKVRCEAGTYAWMQQNSPMVPIPRLHGFALASGHCVRDMVGTIWIFGLLLSSLLLYITCHYIVACRILLNAGF
jgi:hypothetical protein